MSMGTLYVVATPIGNLADLSPRAIDVLKSVSLIAAEDTRHSVILMRAFDIVTPMVSYHRHSLASRSHRLLTVLDQGDVALISDAGTPGIADPGHSLVAAAAAAGHRVVSIPGASSLTVAVSASGLVPGPFMFVGFLPRTGDDRRMVLGKAIATGYPFVIFESPLRTHRTLSDVNEMAPGRSGVVARELTKLHEEIRRGSLSELAGLYVEAPPRGEVVLIVGEADHGPPPHADLDIKALATAILKQGAKPSKAARELSAITGMTAVEAYETIHRIARSDRDR
jgi:16S rRNA (cytidine1402-2'-O)-methyltransferase